MISVIIPVYNTKVSFIKQCIDSVISYSDIEIIIVNDGSTETEVVQICEDYDRCYENIQLINQTNQGLSVARNNGIARAKGEYIAFLDSDDWWSKEVFENISSILEDSHPDVLIFQARKVEFMNGDQIPIGEELPKLQQWKSGVEALKELLKNNPNYEWYAWKYFFSKDLFERTNLRFEKGLYYEDVDLIPRLLYNAKMILSVPEVLLNYRFHNPTSILNTPNIEKSNHKLIVLNRMMNFCLTIEDAELKKELLHNLTQLFLSAYGDYLNGIPVDIIMLKRAFSLAKYSKDRFGKFVHICCSLFGIHNGSNLIRIILKKKNIINKWRWS